MKLLSLAEMREPPNSQQERTIARSDQDVVRSVVLEGLSEHFGFIDESLNPDLDDIAATYPASGHVFLVAQEGDQVVGTVGLLMESPERGRMMRLSVRKDQRRRGIASALLSRLIEVATERGLTELVAGTEADWSDANGFYEAAGFSVLRRSEHGVQFQRPLIVGETQGAEADLLPAG